MTSSPTVPAYPTIAMDIPDAMVEGRVGKMTIYSAINSGDLKSIKIGRRRIILRDSFVDWLRTLERNQASGDESA